MHHQREDAGGDAPGFVSRVHRQPDRGLASSPTLLTRFCCSRSITWITNSYLTSLSAEMTTGWFGFFACLLLITFSSSSRSLHALSPLGGSRSIQDIAPLARIEI